MKNVILLGMLAGTMGGMWSGCTLPSRGPMVPQAQVGVARTLSAGRVVSVETVTIGGQKSNLGSMGGAGIGGAAAATGVGSGTGSILAGAAGAVTGAILGQTVEEAATRRPGQRLVIRMDDGRMVEIVQDAADGLFHEGDRVDVAEGGTTSRVTMSLSVDRGPDAPPAWYER